MKAILTIVFLFIIQNSYSQTDSKKEQSKPSWGNKMPTREVAPDLNFDADLDDDDEMDMGDFGMDRSRLLDSDDGNINDPITIEPPVVTSSEELKKIEEDKTNEQQRKLKEQQRRVEENRIAVEKFKEQQRKVEEERIAEEKLKEQQRKGEEESTAAEGLKEKLRQEEEKRISEQIIKEGTKVDTEEELTEEKPAMDEGKLETVVVVPTNEQKYLWKKIKNVLPGYPSKAAREKKEGWVEVSLTIDSSGNVIDAQILRFANKYRGFNNAAVKAVKRWKYEPPENYGINNQLSKVIRIVFQL